MKNTIRASRKNKPETKASQGKKPSIHGQKTATVCQVLHLAKALGHCDLVILAARFLDLENDQLTSIFAFARWEGRTPQEYLKRAVKAVLSSSISDINTQARYGKAGGEKESAIKILTRLNLPIPETNPGVNGVSLAMQNAKDLLFEAARESDALNELMLNTLNSDNASAFRQDNGYLAAGFQTLARHVKHDLEMAYDALRKANN